jgi:hypothetical protein
MFAVGDANARRTGGHEAMREAPPLAYTGGFGEQSCASCHFDGAVNDSAGSITLEGLPPTFSPGVTYALTLTVKHPALKLAGFELAARFATGADSAKQAGSFRTTGGRDSVSVEASSNVQYVHHLRAGTTPVAPGTGRWTFSWTAPASRGQVAFHIAANAASDDDSPLGDYILTRAITVRAAEK